MGYRDLLKEATRLKKEKKYDEACQTLRVAFQSADVGEYIDIHERLRLPVYLCFANRDDEAWFELNRLSTTYQDSISQIAIRSKMQKFLEDEGRLIDAAFFLAWVYILELKHKIDLIVNIHAAADKWANEESMIVEMKDGSFASLDFRRINDGREPFAFTNAGNPIYDVAHNHTLTSLNDMLDINVIEDCFVGLCEKIGNCEAPSIIAEKIIEIIDGEYASGEWVADLHSFFREQLS
ncbi:TPA: hypothetical protein ACKPUX_005232 [Serratia marcescens]|uniref:hypothetical protein n=1 Tax=Serratia marcescens TaxID=615 RepID=UPI000B61408E|nr:hypothetical protein [Serratia marcescens]ASM31289.1 hypothetical protein BVG84_09815 [Serratia marcescens]HBC7417480.1 hypothetical protein [Serratia marcescens]HBC7422983.1 hypothetical protein [Serratia marcescens]